MQITVHCSMNRMPPHFSFLYLTPLVCFQRFNGRLFEGSSLVLAWLFWQIAFHFKKGGLK